MKIFSVSCIEIGKAKCILTVAACVFQDGAEVDSFAARLPAPHDWGYKLPDIGGMRTVNPTSQSRLEEEFWQFWVKHRDGAIVISDLAEPVYWGLFIPCVKRFGAHELLTRPMPAAYDLDEVLHSLGVDPADAFCEVMKGREVDEADAREIALSSALILMHTYELVAAKAKSA